MDVVLVVRVVQHGVAADLVHARYRTQIAGKPTTFRANLRNVADRAYWASVSQYGSLVQGAPRSLVVSATVDF